MDIDALSEAFHDFEKGKKETSPLLEQFLCHVAKTGQTKIPWSMIKTYFIFKLEKAMDDFHASTPEQRALHNPNVENIPFEAMKKRILKIVDGYNGIPFTIQRLCELITDPKRNYTGTDKFLRGVEKNVMVVSCVYPTSEKNGAPGLNRMNGVMFPGNSLYSDSRNMNGPGIPKSLCRPKLSLSTSFSTNGLPDSTVNKELELITDEAEGYRVSGSSLPQGESAPCTGIKNKHDKEEDDDDEDEDEEHEVKRLKFAEKEEDDREEETPGKGAERSPETQESSEDICGPEQKTDASLDTPATSEDHEPESTETEKEDETSEREAAHSPKADSTAQRSEEPTQSERSSSSELYNGDSNNHSSEGEGPHSSDTLVPSSSCNSCDLSTEGSALNSNSTDTAKEPGEHD